MLQTGLTACTAFLIARQLLQGSVLMFLEGARAEEGETQFKTSDLRVLITSCPRHRQPGGVH